MPALPNSKHERFCQEYVIDFNGTQAAIRAGYSRKTAGSQAFDLLKKPEIQARLTEIKADIAERLEIEQDKVFRRWWDTANADPSELTQHRIGPCRYCWGHDHQFQWKTVREFDEAHALWQAKAPGEGASLVAQSVHAAEEPSDAGGYGYRLTREVNPDCPECAGLGIPYTWMADTRVISPQARLLFRGVKETKNGIEILMSDQDRNLEMVAKRLGMLKDVLAHDVTDPMADLLKEIASKGSTAPLKKDDPE